MAVGNADLIAGLAKVKSNIDSGIFTAVQMAGIEALKHAEEFKKEITKIYTPRRDKLIGGLRDAGWDIPQLKATFYVWAPVLEGYNSASMAKAALEEADIIMTPGNGFGSSGEGYVRMALTVGEERIEEAVERLKKAFF